MAEMGFHPFFLRHRAEHRTRLLRRFGREPAKRRPQSAEPIINLARLIPNVPPGAPAIRTPAGKPLFTSHHRMSGRKGHMHTSAGASPDTQQTAY
jgi:hypothetical protein